MSLLSPHIEKLVLEGKAKYKTFSVGHGSLFTLPVNKDSYIILRQIRFHHFLNSLRLFDWEGITATVLKQLSLYEQGQRNDALKYFFRTTVEFLSTGDEVQPRILHDVDTIETYAIFKKNMCGEIIQIEPAKAYNAANAGKVNPETQERIDPLGIAIGTAVPNAELLFSAGEQYLPAGQRRPLTGVAPTTGYREDLRYNVTPGRLIQSPIAQGLRGYETPIITFGYFEVNEGSK